MPVTPEAIMTNNWRKALSKCILDGTVPTLQTFVWGDGGHVDNVRLKGNTIAGSNQVTNVTDFKDLKVTQLIKGVGLSTERTYVTAIDEAAKRITVSRNATATNDGVSLTLSGPKKEDPTLNGLIQPISVTKPIRREDKQISSDGYSSTFTGSLEGKDLVSQDSKGQGRNQSYPVSEFGILDSNGILAYYFTFTEFQVSLGDVYQLQITVKF